MKILLWILLVLLVLVILIFLSSVHVIVRYENSLYVTLRFWFFKYQAFPIKEKQSSKQKSKQKEPPQEQKPKKKQSKLLEILEKRGLSGFLELLKTCAEIVSKAAKAVLTRFIIEDLDLKISVSDEDAAQTAIYYGYVCGAVNGAMSVLLNYTDSRNYHIQISPDFDAKESKVSFYMKGKMRIRHFAITGVSALKDLIALQKELM